MWLSQALGVSYYLRALTRALFCFVLLVVPTFLMGGTFAVIGKHVVQNGQRLGRDTALLYGLYTAGAVLGAGLSLSLLVQG